MTERSPEPIDNEQQRRRKSRALHIARSLGFVGRVEYRHVYAPTGGAQYCRGIEQGSDLLWLIADAFERDASGDDFTLRSIIAHERGHQLLARHPRLSKLQRRMGEATEEFLASIIGAWICGDGTDRDMLIEKAAVDLLNAGMSAEDATRQTNTRWELLGEILWPEEKRYERFANNWPRQSSNPPHQRSMNTNAKWQLSLRGLRAN